MFVVIMEKGLKTNAKREMAGQDGSWYSHLTMGSQWKYPAAIEITVNQRRRSFSFL